MATLLLVLISLEPMYMGTSMLVDFSSLMTSLSLFRSVDPGTYVKIGSLAGIGKL
jgi:hypothetical protein